MGLTRRLAAVAVRCSFSRSPWSDPTRAFFPERDVRACAPGPSPTASVTVNLDRALLKRFLKFAVVGGSGVFVNLGIYFLLTRPTGLVDSLWGRNLAYALSVELSILSNFLLNDRWTFRDRCEGVAFRHRFLRFHVVSAVGFLINWGVFAMLNWAVEHGSVQLLGSIQLFGKPQNLDDMLAAMIGIGAALSWNFAANLLWTWGHPTDIKK